MMILGNKLESSSRQTLEALSVRPGEAVFCSTFLLRFLLHDAQWQYRARAG